MYLTRIEVKTSSRAALRLLSSPYRVHASVESAFPAGSPRADETGRILWRLEDAPFGDAAWLYVLSPQPPQLDDLIEQLGGRDAARGYTKDYTPVLSGIEAGQVWQFRLKANPVRKVLVDKGRSPRDGVAGTIQGHVTVEQQRNWLMDRVERNGFCVRANASDEADLIISHRRREEFRRGDARVTLTTAFYDGTLEVTDPVLFKKALGFGIGRGKGFGCGLLTIAPVR